MDCPDCLINYELYSFEYHDKSVACEGFRWIRKELYKEAGKLRQESNLLLERAINTAKKRYLIKWISHFDDKSKKSIWTELNLNMKWFPSLGTFYKHTKGEEPSEFLSTYFCENHLADIFNILNIEDDEIPQIFDRANLLQNKADYLLSSK
jgi:hypothetical protein